MILTHDADERTAGRTVYSILRREMAVSASLLRRLKQADGLRVNGASVYSNYCLAPGDRLTVLLDRAEPPCDIVPESGGLEVLFENEGFLAVNKRPGVIVHPSHARYMGTLANFAAGYLLQREQNGCCHVVNRLDRDTSGVVLFAKNSYMKDRLSRALRAADSVKEYCAAVCGVFSPSSGSISLPIRRQTPREMRRIPAPDGQPAVTHYKTERILTLHGETVSLLRLRLETGRTHQIRVHCLSAGHPVLGDTLYCTECSRALSEKLSISAQALHAALLSFTDPLTGSRLTITAPLRRSDMDFIGR